MLHHPFDPDDIVCECGHRELDHAPDYKTTKVTGMKCFVVRRLYCHCICDCSEFKKLDWITNYCSIPERITHG